MQTSHRVGCFTAACLLIAHMAGPMAFAQDSGESKKTADSTSNVKADETKPATEHAPVATTFHIAEVTVERGKPWCDYVPGFRCVDEPERRGVVCHPARASLLEGKPLTPKSAAAPPNATLVGSGDLSVCIPKEDFKDAAAYIEETRKSLHLYVNGVDMDTDATLMATQDEIMDVKTKNDKTKTERAMIRLHYHISPGPHSQNLWATLYRTKGLTRPDALNVSLGWGVTGANSINVTGEKSINGLAATGDNKVSVTDEARTGFAGLMLALLFAGFWLAGAKTGMLRDQSLPAWWKRASSLRNSLPAADPQRAAFLASQFAGTYDATKAGSYEEAANNVLNDLSASGRYTIASAADEQAVIMGLVLASNAWQVPANDKPSFSLAKVQLGVWFLFAVSAGIFLWVVRGQLAALDGSVLVLLGLSTATAGMSIAANSDERNFSRSNGFFNDLMTDSEGKYQVHRLQAVVVNVLLLVVGVFHVMGQLAFPVFETTWLAFLGISGVALAGGKQLLETQEPTKEPPVKT